MLETIEIFKGRVKKLSIDLFPVSVKYLSLIRMGIDELPESFECLHNLRKLILRFNNFKHVNLVKLTLSHFKHLDLSSCQLRSISPFLQNTGVKMTVVTECNWNLDIIEARNMLQKIKGLTLHVDRFHKTLKKIYKGSSRLHCLDGHKDPFFDELEYNASQEVVRSCNSEDLYYGGYFDLDEDESTKKRKKKEIPQVEEFISR